MKNKRKAFTVVELVIVIAVIGILSAILIPVFINLTNKATSTSEELLLRNLNLSLQYEEEDKGKKNILPSDVIIDISKHGFKEDNLLLKSGRKILWNEKDNRFYFSTSLKEEDVKSSFWSFERSYDSSSIYSIYALDNFSSLSISDLKVGLDVGNNNIDYIYAIDARDANHLNILHTNGGDLIINGPNSSYAHYGQVDDIGIISTSITTYYEYGKVNNIDIKEGKIILENNAKVNNIDVIHASNEVIIDSYIETEFYVHNDSISLTTINDYYSRGIIHHHDEVDVSSLSSITSTGNYRLMQDIEVSSSYTIASDKIVNLNLNGHTITYHSENDYLIHNYGTFNVYDRKNKGGVNTDYAFLHNEGGEVSIEGGTYNRFNSSIKRKMLYNNVTSSSGRFVILGGNFNADYHLLESDHGETIIHDGSFNVEGYKLIYLTGDASLTINEGKYHTTQGILRDSSIGQVTINGGTFINENNNEEGILNGLIVLAFDEHAPRLLTINNGTFSSITSKSYIINIDKTSNYQATNSVIRINDGSFTSTQSSFYYFIDGFNPSLITFDVASGVELNVV